MNLPASYPSWSEGLDAGTLIAMAGLPHDYPLHLDSIRAELFTRSAAASASFSGIASSVPLLTLLEHFRNGNNTHHGINSAPSKYAYAAALHPAVHACFGVSGPPSKGPKIPYRAAASLRSYRRRMGWGENVGIPGGARGPAGWEHGNCAENQSLPAVVAQCEFLELAWVEIETYATDKTGRSAPMCRNCELYVRERVLKRNPGWVVVDKASGRRYTAT